VSRHYAHSILRVRAPLTTDRYNNQVRDWAAAQRSPVSGVNVQPAGSPPQSDEDTTGRQTTVTGWRLYTPPGMDIDLLETDRIEYGGMTLEVDGKVGRWRISGRVHHVEAALREVD
jgi:hypothetical protein